MADGSALTHEAHAVLAFWFGSDASVRRREWFAKDAVFDASIRARFEPSVERALHAELQDWSGSAETALARVLLLDQFTRNIYRDSPRAFTGDALALAAANAIVASGQDLELAPLQRAFVYLPFEHAEDGEAQAQSVALFSTLVRETPDLQDMLDYARRHAEVIARFGRFPHRNAVLRRASTAEEASFLLLPGSRF